MAPEPLPSEEATDPFIKANLPYFVNSLLSRDYVKSAGKKELRYSFATLFYGGEQQTYSFKEADKQAVRDALQKFSDVLDLRFVEVEDSHNVDLRYVMDDLNSAGLSAYAGYASSGTGEIHLNSTLFAVERRDATGNYKTKMSLEMGSSGFEVLLHETGHALGLKHPFEAPQLPTAENSSANTVMSYTRSGAPKTDLPMFDVAALQYLYGVAQSSQTGDNSYSLTQRYIDDASGTDTLDASNETQDVSINLAPGSWNYAGAKDASILAAGQSFVGFGTQIENALGGAGNDTLVGNDMANSLSGGLGDDAITGGKGDDLLVGGEGADRYTFTVNDGKDTITESGNNTAVVISGASLDSTYYREGVLHYGTQGDRIALDLQQVNELVLDGVTYDQQGVQSTFGLATSDSGDLVLSAHVAEGQLLGTDGWSITGNTLGNSLQGNAGNNTLDGGTGGDVMAGGAGDDTYIVDNANDVVTEAPNSGLDTVLSSEDYLLTANVENLTLTGEAAIGFGNSLDNSLVGNAQDNVLSAGEGADILNGGLGNDELYGQGGSDTYVYRLGDGTDFIVEDLSTASLPWRSAGGQSIPAYRRCGLHPPLRIESERACAFPRLCG